MEEKREIQSADHAGIRVNALRKTFQPAGVVACDDVDLDIASGELLVLLGPSGCGKTTTLRCIAGLEKPDNEDAIIVCGRNLRGVAPKDRNLAFVFQTTALFPHLNVRRNISFGLDMKKNLGREEIARRVEQAAGLLKIDQLLERYPGELSGGQGQRVALGRAMVMEPNAFLLDEPFASLDAKLRVEMRTEIKLIQRQLHTTMIFVTHDQEEALTIGDKIAVMDEGVVQQFDTPHNIYHRPTNLFVATFIGSPPINLFACRVEERGDQVYLISSLFEAAVPQAYREAVRQNGENLKLGLRPEFISIGTAAGHIAGGVELIELMGSRSLVLVDCKGEEIRVQVQGDHSIREGEKVQLSLDLEHGFFFGADDLNLI